MGLLSTVEISGTKYHQKDIVVRSYEHDEPMFAESFTSLQLHYKSTTLCWIFWRLLDSLNTFMPTEFLPPDQKLTSDLVDYHPLTESKLFNPTTMQIEVSCVFIKLFLYGNCIVLKHQVTV